MGWNLEYIINGKVGHVGGTSASSPVRGRRPISVSRNHGRGGGGGQSPPPLWQTSGGMRRGGAGLVRKAVGHVASFWRAFCPRTVQCCVAPAQVLAATLSLVNSARLGIHPSFIFTTQPSRTSVPPANEFPRIGEHSARRWKTLHDFTFQFRCDCMASPTLVSIWGCAVCVLQPGCRQTDPRMGQPAAVQGCSTHIP